MSPLLGVVIIATCLALEGFFSGSEMAIVQADRLRLRTAAEEGDRGAELALDLLAHEHALFGTCLIGTNLAVVTWSSVATWMMLDLGVESWGALALVPLGLIFGEALPKNIFQAKADDLAPIVAWPLSVLRSLLTPLLLMLDGWNRLLRWAFRGEPEPDMTREELLDLLDDRPDGGIAAEERALIRGVLSLSEITACDCMTPLVQVIAVAETATVAVAAETAIRTQHSRLPVFQKRIDHIIGLVQQTDLLFIREDGARITEHLRPVRYVPEHKPADALFREMRNTGEHFAVVVDEYGGCIGIVTLEDLLEELVGDIEDERAVVRTGLVTQPDGSLAMPGSAAIEDVADALEMELPEGPYGTIAGLLLWRLGRIPVQAEEITTDGLVVTIEAANERAVQRVRVRRA